MDGQRPDDQEQVEHRQSIVLHEGDVVGLTVDDLPGAGYRWVVRDLPDGLTVVSDQADQADPPPAPDRVGGPVPRRLSLRGDLAGTYDVRLELVRPWEPAGSEPAETRLLLVRVEPPAP